MTDPVNENAPLPEHIQRAATAVITGMVPDGAGGGDGITKDDALDFALDLALFVRGLEQVGWRGGVSRDSLHNGTAHRWALTQGFDSHLRCQPVWASPTGRSPE